MILGQLTLTNFSVYAGTQTISLAPSGTKRPIVLIGGLNGAGKTSLLSAVRLALFGKRAMQFHQSTGSYVRLLRSFVHDKSNGTTSIDLEFHMYTLGEKDTYRICRSWTLASNGKVHEDASKAWKNGTEDPVLASAWDDFIDTLMPASIAHLFFFDGEKVAELANTEGARALLSTGIRSLLGIDLLARLQDDLAELISKKSKSSKADDTEETLLTFEAAIRNFQDQRAGLLKDIEATEIRRNEHNQALAQMEIRFNETGAHLLEQRKSLEDDCLNARNDFDRVNVELVELAAGPLPFALIPDLLKRVREQDQREKEAAAASVVLSVLENRDEQTLEMLSDTEGEVRNRLASYLAEDRRKRAETTHTEQLLNLTPDGRHKLKGLEETLAKERSRAQELLSIRAQAETQLQQAERLHAMVPPEETVKEIIQEREACLCLIDKNTQELVALRRKLEQCDAAISFRRVERERALKRLSFRQIEESTEGRVIRYAQKARVRAEAFSQRVLAHSLNELGEQIQESLNKLFRKESYVCRVTIDPEDFTLKLSGMQGEPIPLDRLSAGERQLVIIAILWGLGRASGRPLPLIIDTPLGRLDTKHRNNLLSYYLPDASHQTILLATDAEINKAEEAKLAPYLGGSYALIHDDQSKNTVIKPGYLWSKQ